MKNLILSAIFLLGSNILHSETAYTSMTEIVRLDNDLPPLKKQKTILAPIISEDVSTRAQAIYKEACKFEQREDWKTAYKKMKKAALLGSPEANFNLYVMYRIGRGCKPNMKKSVACCKNAADQGYAPALNSMGMMHELGENEYVEKNLDKALDYYEAAAEKDDVTALDNLERILKDEE